MDADTLGLLLLAGSVILLLAILAVRATLDAFAETLFRITDESGDLLHEAPHSTPISRPDEVRAAKQPIMKWTPD